MAFLAAGTITLARGKLKGFTTGAGMWVAGSIGLACRAGFLSLAIISAVLVLLILLPMHRIERRLDTDAASKGEPAAPPARSSGRGD